MMDSDGWDIEIEYSDGEMKLYLSEERDRSLNDAIMCALKYAKAGWSVDRVGHGIYVSRKMKIPAFVEVANKINAGGFDGQTSRNKTETHLVTADFEKSYEDESILVRFIRQVNSNCNECVFGAAKFIEKGFYVVWAEKSGITLRKRASPAEFAGLV